MSCCLVSITMAAFSRIALVVWWLTNPESIDQAFKAIKLPGFSVPTWLWALAGFLILPWTTLAYLVVSPGGVSGWEWIVLLAALMIDLAGHGGGYRHRRHIRSFRRGRSII